MTVVSGDPTTDRQSFEAYVPGVELDCFARDLGGSTLHVVVAAAGRALGTHADIARTLAGDGGDPSRVGLRMATGRVAVVRDAPTAKLPHLRDEVDRLIRRAGNGRLTDADTAAAPITVVDHGDGRSRAARPGGGTGCVLEFEPVVDDPQALRLTVDVGRSTIGPADATQFLETLARLLAHPYRRLV